MRVFSHSLGQSQKNSGTAYVFRVTPESGHRSMQLACRKRVESRCDAVALGSNISVAAPFVRRCLTGSTVAPFSHPAHRTGQADFPHPACMGLSLSRGRHVVLVILCIPFFCSTRAASILPSRPHISIAVARSGGQGRRFFSAADGLSLTDASTAAGCRRSGGWPCDDPRGACHWPRSIARTTLVFG
ncbi:hypothetical protein SAMN05443247_03788 [Bradyrhizobium erythrophlei]|nr:hypothetical protein SAMN05443247_03788 [Bradyrhizobium erythrophlei]